MAGGLSRRVAVAAATPGMAHGRDAWWIAWTIGLWLLQATYARTPELPRLASYGQLALSVLTFTLPGFAGGGIRIPALLPLHSAPPSCG